MTLAIFLVSMTKHKIGLNERFLIREAISAPHLGGLVKMAKFILLGTLTFEGTGALLLAFYFCPKLGLLRGIYFSIFHSVSAFCNAGFDLMGVQAQFSSLTSAEGNAYVNIIIMLLIIIGGLGFFVWADIRSNKLHFKNLKLHTKIVLTVTGILILSGALLIFLFEQSGTAFKDRPLHNQILISLFQSVSPRTAGFNTIDLSQLTQASQFLIIILMLIGGSPGSTAGGVKTTTFTVLFLSVFTVFRQKKSIECFKRRLDDETLRTASCVFMMYLTFSLSSALAISCIDGLPIHTAVFEAVSAIATVGLSLGVTAQLSIISQILIILLMIFGRVGSLTFLLAFASTFHGTLSKRPLEKIQIG